MAALRAVKDGEGATVSCSASVGEAARSGSHMDLLVAMRNRVADTISDPECPPRDLAALTRRLQDIAKEIEALSERQHGGGDLGGEVDAGFDASAL